MAPPNVDATPKENPLSNADRDTTPGKERQPEEFRMNRIAARAHEIYQARGGEHGRDMDDWLQAEREIDAEIAASGEEA